MNSFEKVNFIFLSQEDVLKVGISTRQVIEIVEKVFFEHGNKRVENPPKPGVHPLPSAFLHAMPAYLSELKATGMKWVSSYPTNAQRNLPAVMGVIIINDCETGQPLAIMDCRWITAIRTGAVSAVAVKYLAKPEAKVLGIVGAGVQGIFHYHTIKETLPNLSLVKYYDLDRTRLDASVAKVAQNATCQVKACSSPQEVIEDSDVIVTATGKLEKVIYFERWVKPGALVLPVHHRGWENQVIQKADRFITDDWAQLSNAARVVGGFDGPLPDPYAELGEIVAGFKPGRDHPDQRIIDFNYGLAMEDIAIAQQIYLQATRLGLGQTLTLMEGDFS